MANILKSRVSICCQQQRNAFICRTTPLFKTLYLYLEEEIHYNLYLKGKNNKACLGKRIAGEDVQSGTNKNLI